MSDDTRRPVLKRRGEARLPAVLAVGAVIGVCVVLPTKLLLGPKVAVPVLAVLLLGPLIAINPVRMTRETRFSRGLSIVFVLLLMTVNLVILGHLVHDLVESRI